MSTSIIEAAAKFAEAHYPPEGVPHIREMLNYCALFAEATGADREILIVTTYLHDVAAHLYSWEEHDVKSAEMACKFLKAQGYPADRSQRVVNAIMAHRLARQGADAENMELESKLIYDADKLARSMGMGIPQHLMELGAKSGGKPSLAEIAAAVRAAQKQMEQTYKSLYTDVARNLARQSHENTRAFCESLIALARLHPSSATW